jgi:hypothetical protein
MNIPEFNIGDVVTFRAYANQNIKAVVRAIISPNSGLSGDYYSYKVEGISEPLNSITSGVSLVESKIFKCPIKYPFTWS